MITDYRFKILNTQKGMATFEMLIAMAIIVLVISTVLPLSLENQSINTNSQINQEAVYKAKVILEEGRAKSITDFGSVKTSEITEDDIYKKQLIVDQNSITQCGKNIKGSISFETENLPLKTELITHLSDIPSAIALGGNCDDSPPSNKGWSPPAVFGSSNLAFGSPTSLDVMNRIVYIGGDQAPYLYIANTNEMAQGTNNGLFVDFLNGFTDDKQINDIKVARFSNGKFYAFVARGSSADKDQQFEIIDVTDINNPFSVAKKSLAGVNPKGSYPQGWRLFYYENRVYIFTRETAGPEFHIFDVSDPNNPVEIGNGINLSRTVENFLVTKKTISGVERYFIYMATDRNLSPLNIFEVDPDTGTLTEITGAQPIFSGYQDGQSVFLVGGNRLYFGRDSDPSGSELFIYDISDPLSGSPLPILSQADISTSVIGIFTSGPFTFLATKQSNKQFKVWHSDPDNFTPVYTSFNLPDILNNGIKYEKNRVYIISKSTNHLVILYDNNP